MNTEIFIWLLQDGVTNGAIYSLVALALLIIFTVTRVIFVPQGELVTFAALSLAMLESGRVPGTVYFLVIGGLLAAIIEIVSALRSGVWRQLPRSIGLYVVLPIVIAILVSWAAPYRFNEWLLILFVIIMSVPLGPILYRIAYQPLANASVLVLFIASIAVHYILMGFALIFFGGEGFRSRALIDSKVNIGIVQVGAQSVLIIAASLLIMLALYLIFEHFIYGKALRATAMNRLGAALVGIPTALTGYLTFLFASFIGAVSGVLIAPTTTIYYDTGFLIALKGFVGAILGGMASYPFAVIGSTVVGLIESFSSFWASVFKEAIVFTMIIPILAWLSLRSVHIEDEEEN